MREGNVFVLSVHISVYVSVCAKTFECIDIKNFISGMVGHLVHTWVKFEYQGHWVKVKITLVK